MFALALTASVSDGCIFVTRDAIFMFSPQALVQRLLDERRHQPGDLAAELRDLLDQRRADVEILLARHEEDGVDALAEPAIHVRELELVLEVGERAQAAHDDVGAALLHVVDEQALERVDLDAARVGGVDAPSRMCCLRSSTVNSGALRTLLAMATTTLSNIASARCTMSMCPLVIGIERARVDGDALR